ncbi:GPI mannosyltransferase 3 like protein [Argiope bruennichi]|uniref:Mannosyltransferase n=1 Tax=Argiope bruennichi TaxID=94029 RepID=A0A8T0FY30_ARGBR|nr:GPI mannosyltransferase 3 like protein [Argiope bruennichi]
MAETSFTSCGLYFYPWNTGKHKGLTCSYLWFAGVSCLIRPTAAILWLPLYLYHLWREKDCICMLGKTLFIGCIILSILLCCDRYFYGEWVLTPYNFFLFNWSNDIGAFYGQHNFLWYFFSGFPVVLGIHLLPFLMGFSLPYLRHFYLLIFWMILVLRSKFIKGAKINLQLSHILKKNSNVLFLMPCHSTPYYSYIHQNVSMKFLSCEPNFNNVDDYMEEADIFFDNPEFWLFQNYEKNDILIIPSHIVMFDTLFPQISRFLDKYNYSLCYQTFHSHFPESKTGQYVLIYCR